MNGVISARSRPVHVMKYFLIAVVLASIAGLEFFHVLSSRDAPGATLCTAQDERADSIRDRLFAHFRNH